jgi:DNA-cytosine methyltransferase
VSSKKRKDGPATKTAKSKTKAAKIKHKPNNADKKAKSRAQKSRQTTKSAKQKKAGNDSTDAHDFVKKLAKRTKRAESPEPAASSTEPDTITVGSDCTGYGSDFIALSLLNLNVSLAFVAEKDPGKRELMKAAHRDVNWANVIVYHDITKRDNNKAPYVDLFYTGAPCQAYSQAGVRMALDDAQDRGVVIFHSIDYIRCKRPKIAIIENVKGLTMGANKEILDTIIGMLKDLGYTVEWKVLNTKDNGIPQSRPRVYIVAIRTRHLFKSISFPKAVKCNLTSFIDVDDKRPPDEAPVNAKCFKDAMAKAIAKYGKDLDEKWVVVDTSSSEKFSIAMEGCVPCITKSRGRTSGHWICKLNRYTTLVEIAALQGLPKPILDRMMQSSQSQGDIGAAIGDAMSINVVMRVSALALASAGMIDKPCPDIWQQAHSVPGLMPDALYMKRGCLKHLL